MQSVFNFSDELRSEAIDYFKKRFKEPVTNEQVDLYLEELAGLVGDFEAMGNRRRASHLPP